VTRAARAVRHMKTKLAHFRDLPNVESHVTAWPTHADDADDAANAANAANGANAANAANAAANAPRHERFDAAAAARLVADANVVPRGSVVIVFVPDPIVIDQRISVGSDDAEEKPSGGIRLSSGDLDITEDGSGPQVVGMRFPALNIPPGAFIQQASLQFQADESNTIATSLTIQAEASDDASPFQDINSDLTVRPTTSASVSWTPTSWTRGEAGPNQKTPDLASLIQEIVNRPGWAAGNALAFLITGTGKRTAESFEGNAAAAPLLHVEYITGNLIPTTTGIADVSVNLDAPDTVIDLFAAFDDAEDPDSALTYTIEQNTNPSIFDAVTIDPVLGTLTLDYAPSISGSSDLTVRATDTGNPPLSVEGCHMDVAALIQRCQTETMTCRINAHLCGTIDGDFIIIDSVNTSLDPSLIIDVVVSEFRIIALHAGLQPNGGSGFAYGGSSVICGTFTHNSTSQYPCVMIDFTFIEVARHRRPPVRILPLLQTETDD